MEEVGAEPGKLFFDKQLASYGSKKKSDKWKRKSRMGERK